MNTRTFFLAGLVILVLCLPSLAQSNSTGGIGPGKATVNGHSIVHAVIESKPDPSWPKTIKANSDVIIVLHAVFRSNGKVTDVRFVETRPKGQKNYSKSDIKDLTRKAIDAAYQIKFIPATRDGLPVSMRMELEYDFGPEHVTKPSESAP